MASLSDYAENAILDHLLGTSSFTMPSQLYVALYTAAPSDAGGGTQVTGTAYARQAVDFDAASGGATDATADIVFPIAGSNWGTITHIALFDASSSGNMIMWCALASSKTINTGDQFVINAADLDVSIN